MYVATVQAHHMHMLFSNNSVFSFAHNEKCRQHALRRRQQKTLQTLGSMCYPFAQLCPFHLCNAQTWKLPILIMLNHLLLQVLTRIISQCILRNLRMEEEYSCT